MRCVWVALGILCISSSLANADHLTAAPEIPRAVPLKVRMERNLTQLSLDMGVHLRALSHDLFSMEFDLAKRLGRFQLRTGHSDRLSLGIHSDVKFRAGYARFKTTIDLRVGGDQFVLTLPEFDAVPRSYGGDQYVEIRLPILKGTF